MAYSSVTKNPFLAMNQAIKGQNSSIKNAIATAQNNASIYNNNPNGINPNLDSTNGLLNNPLKYSSTIYGNNDALYGSNAQKNTYNAGTVNVTGNYQNNAQKTASFGQTDYGAIIAKSSETAGLERTTTSSLDAKRTFNPNSPDVNFKVDPKIYEGFNNLPEHIFGGKQGLEGYYGQMNGNSQNSNGGSRNYNGTKHMTPRELELYGNGQQNLRDGYTTFADGYKSVNPPADSALNQVTNDPKELSNLYNGVRSRIGGLFSDDKHMDQAIQHSVEKLGTEYQDLARNSDTMSLITGMNISKHGIQESGFGDVMRSYADVANDIPKGMLNQAWKNAYDQAGGGLEGLKAAANVQTKDYGHMELNSDQVKEITHEINTAMFNEVAKSAGFDLAALQKEHEANGFNKENSNYQLSGAYLASSAAASQLTQTDANGKNGFEKIVEQSQAAHGGRDTNGSSEGLYNATLNIMISNDPSADGSAFASTEEGLTGLAGLMPFTSGLSDNPNNPNAFNLAFQGNSQDAMAKIDEFMSKAKEAGINFNNVNLTYKGHGGEDGHTMLKEGIVTAENNFGKKDAQQMGDILSKHVADGAQVNVTADSCYGKRSSSANADAIAQAAGENGKSIKVTDSGSNDYGLVDSHQIHSSDNGFERLVRNDDGSVVSQRDRADWSESTDTRYSKGKENFDAVSSQIAQNNAELRSDFDTRANSEWTSNTNATENSEASSNFAFSNESQETQNENKQEIAQIEEHDEEKATA